MKVFNTAQIHDLDAYTVRHEPVASIDLMERAAKGCTAWIHGRFPRQASIVVFAGPGNNGGDGWAIARLLTSGGHIDVTLFYIDEGRALSPDAAVNRKRLEEQGLVQIMSITGEDELPVLRQEQIVIDALFGSGLKGPLQGLAARLVEHINRSGSTVVSVDIPSGMHGDDNSDFSGSAIIRATYTLSLEFPKRSFFYAENQHYTGDWHIISIGLHAGIVEEMETPFHYLTRGDLAGNIPKRRKFSHKGTYGHALLVAGSYGMLGAAVLAARACLRSGAGLLTTHVPAAGYPVVQAAVPESVFSIDPDPHCWTSLPATGNYSAAGAGPGIGTAPATGKSLASLLERTTVPMVLDADALNLLARNPGLLLHVRPNTILTPHPGEFDRLAGKSPDGFTRNQKQIEMAREKRLIIILKGAFTSIAMPDGTCFFNSTGNPGMATAGAGDVLTGVILSLLAQGISPADAALTGTYLHGLAGDLAEAHSGQQALIASDLVENLGNAFKTLEYDNNRK
jgi:NAD(P)H-hydrate epimerase